MSTLRQQTEERIQRTLIFPQPLSVQLEQTILCDDMPPPAGIQLGPTSKSVARSYAVTLNRLVPAGSPLPYLFYFLQVSIDLISLPRTTVNIFNKKAGDTPSRYQYAIKYMTEQDPSAGKKRIDFCIEKQAA
jgi:hypothetical protein